MDDIEKTKNREPEKRVDVIGELRRINDMLAYDRRRRAEKKVELVMALFVAVLRGVVVVSYSLAAGVLVSWLARYDCRVRAFYLGSVLAGIMWTGRALSFSDDETFWVEFAGLIAGIFIGIGWLLPAAAQYVK